jgi:ATP-dependent DNA helicase RecQ
LKIINDKESKYIVVAAGPGSGKTRILAHKLAALLLMEDVKHEQLLMLTFSRAAATEFKKRLMTLIGNAALYVDIKTFHSYCFDILGKMGTLEKADQIVATATELIRERKVEIKEVTKTVLVIDEAQDMSAEEFGLVEALMAQNEGMRVIAVGDDDQNIYGFRGSNSIFLEKLVTEKGAVKYELVDNYRSKANLVGFTNQLVGRISTRLKQNPIVPKDSTNGVLKVTKYVDKSLIEPLVSDVLETDLSGSVAVLTKTNEEALKVAGLIRHHKLPVRLIQSDEQFNLLHLQEVRFFLGCIPRETGIYTISAENWDHALHSLKREFLKSTKLEVVLTMLDDFEKTNPKTRYINDLEAFIAESKLEDFYRQGSDAILVSTIHKAKGKEFDQVFMLLHHFNHHSDAEIRLLYVGMTRAKSLLSMHCRSDFLDGIKVEDLAFKSDLSRYPDPDTLVMHLFYKEIWLTYFFSRQGPISRLRSGDRLRYDGQDCLDQNGKAVLRFSNAFKKTIEDFSTKGYYLREVSVNWLVFWTDAETGKEALIVLPEVVFEKTNS